MVYAIKGGKSTGAGTTPKEDFALSPHLDRHQSPITTLSSFSNLSESDNIGPNVNVKLEKKKDPTEDAKEFFKTKVLPKEKI